MYMSCPCKHRPPPIFGHQITSAHVCLLGTIRNTQDVRCVLSVSTHPRFWSVTVLCAHDVRCVLNTSTHVQVTVTEKDRAIQETEREKERAVQEKQNVIQQKERVIRDNEQLIQTLLVCV